MRALAIQALLVVACLAAAPGAASARIVSREVTTGRIATMVGIESVRRDGTVVRVRLRNLTDRRVVNVRVLVTESFRWTNEQHPGSDDPSQALAVTLPESIGPNATFEATVSLPPPPTRPDGTFVLGASVVGLDVYPAR